MAPREFWRTTPREFWSWVTGCRKAEKANGALMTRTAWLSAMWSRAEKMPSMESALRPYMDKPTATRTRALTATESKQRVRRAFAAWGFVEKRSA